MLSPAEGRAFLGGYDLTQFADRFAADHPYHDDEIDECDAELRKFLELPLHASCNHPIAAMSNGVDAYWHTIIIHTPQYQELCEQLYGGRFLHHQPRDEQHPVPKEAISNFFLDYPKVFGTKVPKIWLKDIPQRHRNAVLRGEVPDEVTKLRWSGWPGW